MAYVVSLQQPDRGRSWHRQNAVRGLHGAVTQRNFRIVDALDAEQLDAPDRADDVDRLRAFKHALYEAFFCEGLDIASDAEIARAAGIAGLDPVAAIAAAYDHTRFERLRSIRREAEAAGVAGVPTLLAEGGGTHWGMGGVERLLAGESLVPRATG